MDNTKGSPPRSKLGLKYPWDSHLTFIQNTLRCHIYENKFNLTGKPFYNLKCYRKEHDIRNTDVASKISSLSWYLNEINWIIEKCDSNKELWCVFKRERRFLKSIYQKIGERKKGKREEKWCYIPFLALIFCCVSSSREILSRDQDNVLIKLHLMLSTPLTVFHKSHLIIWSLLYHSRHSFRFIYFSSSM